MAFKLGRLPPNYDKQQGLLARYWDTMCTAIEKTINDIIDLPEIQDAISQAQAAADDANVQVESTASKQSLINSYVTGLTISSDATGLVTVSSHTRVYSDSVLDPAVSVTGNTIATGAAVGSTVRVYYTQANRSGGTVTYQYTVDPAFPPVQDGNVHSVGAVIVPAAGTQNGKPVPPPGFVNI